MRGALLLLVGVASGCMACAGTPAAGAAPPVAAPTSGPQSAQSVVPGEYILTFAVPADVELATQVVARFGPRRVKDLGGGRFLVALEKDPGIEVMRELPRQDDRVRAVQPNFAYRISQ